MPIDLPAVRWMPTRPRLLRSNSVSRAGVRLISVVEYADPAWEIPMATVPLGAAEAVMVEAFIEEAREGLNSVLWTPKHICLPQAYWGQPAAPALANEGALVSVTGGTTIAVDSVTNGLALTRGDLIGMADGAFRGLFRVVTGAVAAANALTLVVEPPVPPYLTPGSTVVFKNPRLNTRVVPGTYTMSDGFRPTASFTLTEVPK